MSDIQDWRYFFQPEDSSLDACRRTVPNHLRIGKTLLWACIAVFFGLLLGHAF
ncbi:hypothetical protein BerOc1_01846 [Pseudodesulfovibrio hydrargyri]|uniref:Uncharacterized protein n=1 Tax=Pseudodesulfovibrio hydrargyri TaxID=2125990 RepID=A0A1J5MTH3_9BACT|nr:hypothetical protein [Pseudodesulfovibrio hydrargyri]OIQ49918.1 hypothetical protein BerOc1_01846 [Pseudodesulfovibrio hydrargyri]